MQDLPAHMLVNGIRSALEGTVVALPCRCALNWKMPRTKSSPGVSGRDLSEVSRASSAELRWIWPFRTESWKINNDCIIRYEAEISVRPVPVGVYIYRGLSPVWGWVNNNIHTADWTTEAGKLRDLPNFIKPLELRLYHSQSLCERIQVSFHCASLWVLDLETHSHQTWEFVFFPRSSLCFLN